MQEQLSVPLSLLHKSTILTLDQLALVETLGIGAHAVERGAVKSGNSVVIVGAGPIGIAVAQFAAERGAKAHILETSEWRREFVEKMGFEASMPGGSHGADVVFDATGSAVAMGESLRHVAAGGTLVFVGLTRDPVCVDDAMFHRKEAAMLASRNSFGLFPQIIRLIEESRIDTTHWITDRLNFSDVESQFPGLPDRKTLIKAIVDIR
jgi:threonine dehydrogenase-like Zn-dependent dehydrogenase